MTAANWILNTNRDDEPVFLEGQESRAYSLENVSEQQIVSITMGCATMNGHKPEILHEFAAQVVSLGPGRIFYRSCKHSSADQAECAHFHGSKLGVVHVGFGDGTDWYIN